MTWIMAWHPADTVAAATVLGRVALPGEAAFRTQPAGARERLSADRA